MDTQFDSSIEAAVDAIRSANALWIGAGAGMGVDSGLPDFRGDEGFWNAYPPFRKLGLNFYDLANPSWFQDHPARAWGFYGHRLNLYRATKPHEGFELLAIIAERFCNNYFVFTSNVDGHFDLTGFDAERIVECHGSINYFQCASNCSNNIWKAPLQEIRIDEESMLAAEPLPRCPDCRGIARPNILMFGDDGWFSRRTDRQYQLYSNWLRENRERKVVGIELGAGTAVPTVRHEAEARVHQLVRINPREAQGSAATISIELGALESLRRMSDILNQE